jgi:hypothetical protein
VGRSRRRRDHDLRSDRHGERRSLGSVAISRLSETLELENAVPTNHISVLNDAIGAENGNKARAALRNAGYVIYRGDPSAEMESLRAALKTIAGWSQVNYSNEYESGLRGIIRSMTDKANEALSR